MVTPYDVLRAWVRKNRPDCSVNLELILSAQGASANATRFLIDLAFAAGRQYQADHKELHVLDYAEDRQSA